MTDSLQTRCAQFIANKETIRSGFRLEYGTMHCLCALLYGGQKADVQKIKTCKSIIKGNTTAFSSFKSNAFLAFATLLALEDDPEKRFVEVSDIYSVFKEKKFWGSEYLAVAAFSISAGTKESIAATADKAKDIYKQMKELHPFLASSEDYGYAAMMALSRNKVSDIVTESERCYKLLEDNFFSKNAVHSLSLVLSLWEERADTKCEKVIELFRQLKERGYKYGTGYELPCLGALAMTADTATIEDVIETSDFLKQHRGFGALGIGKAQRIMYASALVAQDRIMGEGTLTTAVMTAVTNIILAMQMAMIAAISASASAAASSSHGS